MSDIIVVLNNVIAILMVVIEKSLVKVELRIRATRKRIEENFDYAAYKKFQIDAESALRNINNIEKTLTMLNKTLIIIDITIEVQKQIINVLTALPILPAKLIDILINVKIILSDAQKLIRMLRNLNELILRRLAAIKAALQEAFNIFTRKVQDIINLYNEIGTFRTLEGYNGLVPNSVANNSILNTNSSLINTNTNTNIFIDNGYNFTYQQVESIILDFQNYDDINDIPDIDITYKGYRFKLIDLDSTIPNIKKRYAIAVDENDVERFRSEISFTLRPAVLIESLKFKIDNFLINNFQ